MQYFERLTNEARRSKLIKNVHPIYVSAPGESYFSIHGQIIDKLAGSFLSDLVSKLRVNQNLINELSQTIRTASEFLKVIKVIAQPTQMSLSGWEERQKDAFLRWLKGQQRLTAADKKLLTDAGDTPVDITSSSLAMRFLYGFLEILKELNMCNGIILLFDEFEEIFEGLTRSHQARYAQDLRHFFDVLNESVFFVIATTPEPRDLAQYPAIERRLGEPVELQPIDSLELATTYVLDYLNSGRNKYEIYLKEHEKQNELDRPRKLEPLTKDDVKNEYDALKEELEKSELAVLPGYFLPRMRERMRQIVESGD
ncbi:MAG: DUF2791 family P-loop domain-containing protein [Candidatus Poribacteria bacterium]|nr:DUF2791 family P-loop domain-containing protein [Candidatus Poribacteria bacterium]